MAEKAWTHYSVSFEIVFDIAGEKLEEVPVKNFSRLNRA